MKNTFVDLDGVIANWTKGLADTYNIKLPSKKEIRPYYLDDILTRNQIDSAMMPLEFWVNLEPFPWAGELIDLVNSYCPKWRFLTKANTSAYAFTGKALWVDKHFPQHSERLIVMRGDKSFANRGSDILIDDHPQNIKAWGNWGGNGYLWPEITADSDYRHRLISLEKFLQHHYRGILQV